MILALFRLEHGGETKCTAAMAMVISSGRRVIGVLVLATGLSVGGCQNAVSVGVFNRCGVDVEIQADSVTESSSRWTTVRAGDRDAVVDVPENAETLYVRVGVPATEETRRVDVPMTSLGRPLADVGAQLVLAGDRCP
jgi:hypothetical protein